MIKLLMVEDHTMIRESLCHILDLESDIEVVGQADDGRAGVNLVGQFKPHVVLMDISMKQMNGFEATLRIKAHHPDVHVIMLTQYELADYIFKAFDSGASGYLLKKSALQELVQAIHAVMDGEFFISPSISRTVIEKFLLRRKERSDTDGFELLTNREREVLQLIGEGHNARAIADTLCISPKTVDVHRTNIMKKLDKHSMVDLARYAIVKGISEPLN